MTPLQSLAARLRNVFTLGKFERRDDAKITAVTRHGRVVSARELNSYGLAAKATRGEVVVLSEGGEVGSPVILAVMDGEGAPQLDDDDVALYTREGAFIVARNDGTCELNGSSFGGIVKAQQLSTELAKNNAILTALLAVISGVPIPEPGNGAPSSLQAALAIAAAGKAVGDFSQLENSKVKHGDS